MVTTSEDIVRKVRALLNLSSSSNANESASALAKAQALLTQYNLSMLDVAHEVTSDPLEKYTSEVVTLDSRARWRKTLFYVLAHNNFCRNLEYRGTNRTILIGEPHNIVAVREMYAIIAPQVAEMARTVYTEWEASGGRGIARVSWEISFCMGVVSTINRRLQEERSAAANDVRALVVMVEDELQQKQDKLFPKVGKCAKIVTKSREARLAGMVAGERVTWKKELE